MPVFRLVPSLHVSAMPLALAMLADLGVAAPVSASPAQDIRGYSAHAVSHIEAYSRKTDWLQTVTQAYDVRNVLYHYDGATVGYDSVNDQWISPAPLSMLRLDGQQSVETGGVIEIGAASRADASDLGISRAVASASNTQVAAGWTSRAAAHTRWADHFVTYDPLCALSGASLCGGKIDVSFGLSTHVLLQDLDGAGAGRAEFNVFVGLSVYESDGTHRFDWKIIHGRNTQYGGSGEWTDDLRMDFQVNAGLPYEVLVDFNVYAFENAVADGFHTGRVSLFQVPTGYVTTSTGLELGAVSPSVYGGLATPVDEPATPLLLALGLAGVGLARRRARAQA